jgi:Kef-type K+ transport system membrane component KefB
MTAAAFPWVFAAAYFIFIMRSHEEWTSSKAWIDALLLGRFASPTSAGVLFSMLAAAGLAATWVYAKARILAIFDDIDTVLLMIPLKMIIVGPRWQLAVVVVVMVVMIWLAWKCLHALRLPLTWAWVLLYAALLALVCESLYYGSKLIDRSVPIHLEVLLPAFVLGCMIAQRPGGAHTGRHAQDETPDHHARSEAIASAVITGLFMFLVGMSMPSIASMTGAEGGQTLNWTSIAMHVLAVTFLANLGKMFPAFCYRREAPLRERLAVCVGMWPRGEVGAGVLIVSLSYGISGPDVIVGMLSLALNLVLTGVFILIVKRLIGPAPSLATR